MSESVRSSFRLPVAAYGLIFTLTLLALPWLGAERVLPGDVLAYWRGEGGARGAIFMGQRLPRVVLALLAGGFLSMTGAALQVLFRNPLAEPWTLGVSGGAAVGVFVAQAFPALRVALGPLNSTQALALAGAGAVMALVWSFSRRGGGMSAHTLLLAGVTVSIVSGGVIMLMVYFVSPYRFVSYHRWMMGGLDVVGFREVASLLFLGLPGVALLAFLARDYNHLALGEDLALGHGVDVGRVRVLTFVGAGLTTAACVAVTGPIAFVGMMIPHAVRKLSGYDHRVVLPGAFLLGGAALALCDGLARTAAHPTEIPVGVITAVIGGPLFLFLLARK
jgi:iron complex transport system permease protein